MCYGIGVQHEHISSMAFKLSNTARSQSAAGNTTGGGYLSPSKVPSGGSVRFHIIDAEPLEYFCVWGQSAEGQLKPFRFVEEPTPNDIAAELGDFERRKNREETAFEAPKFALSFAVWNYDTGSIQICEFSQKSLIRELDKISQEEDYSDFNDWDFKLGKEGQGLTTEYTLRPVPCKDNSAANAAYQKAVKEGFDLKRLLTGANPFKAD